MQILLLKAAKKMVEISKKLSKTVQNRQQSVQKSKKCWSYFQNLATAKKCGIYLPNPTAGLQTYWARGAQVPQQFAALSEICILNVYVS